MALGRYKTLQELVDFYNLLPDLQVSLLSIGHIWLSQCCNVALFELFWQKGAMCPLEIYRC